MKIIVTGTSGFLGKRAAKHFEKQDGNTVFAPSHAQMDITSEKSDSDYFSAAEPDAVIHCAAVSDIGECAGNPERSSVININGSENIARAAKKHGAKCVICSSDQVYSGSTSGEPHREDETLSPDNVYGRQKLCLEKSCLEINPDSVLLRLTWMYDLNKSVPDEKETFITMLISALMNKEKLIYPRSDRRGLTDVNSVVSELDNVIKLPGGVYNYGSYNNMSMYETAKAALGGRFAVYEKPEDFCGSTRNLCMNDEKLKSFGIFLPDTVSGIRAALQKAGVL